MRSSHESRASLAIAAKAEAAAVPATRSDCRHPVLRAIDFCAESLVVAALLAELGLVLANVLARTCFQHSFLWSDEVARWSLSVLAFIGGAVAYRRRDHAFIRIVHDLLPASIAGNCLVVAQIIVLLVVSLTGIASLEFVVSS